MSIDPKDVRVVLPLRRLGELIVHTVVTCYEHHGIEMEATQEEAALISKVAWEYLTFMFDREEFQKEALADIAALEVVSSESGLDRS